MTTASQIEQHGARAAGRADSGRMFRRATRHSRLIRILRIGVPLTVVIGAALTFAVMTVFNPLRALVKLPVDISGLVISGTKITMQAPRLVGYTRDNRPYSLTARAAAQDVTNPDMLELQDIHASMELQDRGAFKLQANTGVYDSKADKLTLRQNVVVTSADYTGHLTEANVEVRKGYIVSEKPVEVEMRQGTISANRLEVENSGEIIRFGNGVTMVVTSEGADPQTTSAIDRQTADASSNRKAGGQ